MTSEPTLNPRSRNPAPAVRKGGITGFRDLAAAGAARPPGNSDDESDDEDKPQSFYTGGEKSGLSVQDPSKKKAGHQKVIQSLLKKAAE
jgi:UBX domain-containing protein 1